MNKLVFFLVFIITAVYSAPRAETRGMCFMELQTGECFGFFPRFGFDESVGGCKKFVYGGCGGNANNFQSMEECRRACIIRN